MPSFPNLLGFKIFIWSNEGCPLEPAHIHVTDNIPSKNATKFWILSNGKVELASNGSHLSEKDLSRLKRALEDYTDVYVAKWEAYHNVKATFHDKMN
ncbi:hypothetical protein bpr_II262 (plasmid) [Butyrivibrio proteoclasticus B316]|uniref:DUF4160 domain-containing protein n=2 Tax=Butyrivibrio proteoclasticus TaxID=43305 RepID=E0S467_BUTPB|nr:hypothetical protein bpr_II262 [Butyrivibrio proteoclasticus B316]